ncbi:MAG: hypothetical protein AAB414_04625 [Patescibacteria group bacterium]
MNLEQLIFKLTNVDPESSGVRGYSVAVFELFAKLDWLLHRTTYHGLLPTTGPMLMVANHTRAWDIAKGYRVGQRSGRIVRAFARATLLDPNLKESEEVRERTGRKNDLLNNGPRWIRSRIAAILNGVEAILIDRGGSLAEARAFKERGREALGKGFLTAVFIMETREKSGRIVNPRPGAAYLAKNNPDIPIYPVGFSKNAASIGPGFTYNQMIQDPDYGELANSNFTVLLCDRIADQLPDPIRSDWYDDQRQKILDRK